VDKVVVSIEKKMLLVFTDGISVC